MTFNQLVKYYHLFADAARRSSQTCVEVLKTANRFLPFLQKTIPKRKACCRRAAHDLKLQSMRCLSRGFGFPGELRECGSFSLANLVIYPCHGGASLDREAGG